MDSPSVSPARKRARSSSPENLEKFIRKNSIPEEQFIKDFALLKMRSSFSIIDFPAHPEALIGGIFNHCAEEAAVAAEGRGLKPDQIGFSISSERLEKPIYAPFMPIHKVTMDSLLVLFLKVEESETAKGNSLFGAPLHIEITLIQRSALPYHRPKLSGGGRPRRPGQVRHQIAHQNLIKIPEQKKNRCLFYALHAALAHQIKGLDKKQFQRYRKNQQRYRGQMDREVKELMVRIGAPWTNRLTWLKSGYRKC